jgi:hypothetical protein
MLAVYRALYVSILLAFSRRIIRDVCSESICLIPVIPCDYDGFVVALTVSQNNKLDTKCKIPIAKIPVVNDVQKLMLALMSMRSLTREVYGKEYSENFRFGITLYSGSDLASLNISHTVPGIPSRVLDTIIMRLQGFLKAEGL